jgi:mRNA interferase RelE/StbE
VRYAIDILRSAQKQLERVPAERQDQILSTLEGLAEVPWPDGCAKLTGREAWRIRVGDYRVIYEIRDDTKIVIVVVIAHRKDAYR